MNKTNLRSKVLTFSAAACFAIAFVLFVVIQVMQIDRVSEWYKRINDILLEYEHRVENLGNQWLIVLVIELNFLVKSVIPWIPISCICVISGVVFPWHIALAINITGVIMQFSVKYVWGKRLGGGNTEKFLSRYDNIYKIIDNNRLGRPLALFLLRLIPCVPLNSVSQLYGSLGIEYWKYIILSFLGIAYRLFTYTVIGRNVYDPLSAKFIVPLITLFFISGFALLAINGVTHVTLMSVKKLREWRIKIKGKLNPKKGHGAGH